MRLLTYAIREGTCNNDNIFSRSTDTEEHDKQRYVRKTMKEAKDERFEDKYKDIEGLKAE